MQAPGPIWEAPTLATSPTTSPVPRPALSRLGAATSVPPWLGTTPSFATNWGMSLPKQSEWPWETTEARAGADPARTEEGLRACRQEGHGAPWAPGLVPRRSPGLGELGWVLVSVQLRSLGGRTLE